MKIDPGEKQQQIISPNTVKPADVANDNNEFAKVLGGKVQKSSGPSVEKCHPVRSPMASNMNIQSTINAADCHTAHGLLDALESYQKLLENPDANLRMVAPAVDTMRSLAQSIRPILDYTPGDTPVEGVVQEALAQMSKEIERFDMGYYIDD